MTPAERSLRARIGGLSRAALYDGRIVTASARRAFLDRFLREVDPTGELPQAERERRAEAARRAHMSRLALRSARARSRKKH